MDRICVCIGVYLQQEEELLPGVSGEGGASSSGKQKKHRAWAEWIVIDKRYFDGSNADRSLYLSLLAILNTPIADKSEQLLYLD